MNYHRTLIAVADDCPVAVGTEPVPWGGRKTVAVLQYEMLTEQPGRLTQEDVLFLSWLRRQPVAGAQDGPHGQDGADTADGFTQSESAALRDRFFSVSRACLRASPLPKKYGFGFLFDADGRVTLCPMESAEYRALIETPGDVRIVKAMRSSRR